MKKGTFLAICTLVFGLTINSYISKYHTKKTEKNLEIELIDENNNVNDTSINKINKAIDVTITMRTIADFLETKKEHYPLSDEFIERYQQASGGYIDNAKKAGLLVDREMHEPNQKWHFFDSWLYPSIDDGSLTWDEDAKSRVYTKLLCPELLLWIYEACEVDPVKVRNAKIVAEQGRAANTNVSTIAKNMRACVPWEDLQNTIANSDKEIKKATSVTLNPSSLELTVGGQDAKIVAMTEPIDTTDRASWSVIEGENCIKITPSANEVTVHALKEGTAKIKVTYNENVSAECLVTIKASSTSDTSQAQAKYNIKYDLGSRTTSKLINSTEELFDTFEFDIGEDIITSISQMEYIYGGGYGGSGDTKWYAGNMLKFGTTSVNGSLTFALNTEINRVKITGYVSDGASKIRVGDSDSSDWTDETNDNKTTLVTCTEMNETAKDVVESNQTSTITIDFVNTKSLKIATTNKKPLYITSIEFICVK
ncbi:MAG: hypothetical protein J1F32_02840 [Erysipelotrichales bacterium]|nr:hypothetical protein [Erysipelotrichales bacterium]